MNDAVTIPGAHARAFTLKRNDQIRIVNLEGSQVVDAWAFSASDLDEFMSNEHTRSCLEKLIPGAGDSLYSNRRRPILSIVADSSPGIHDLLLSACDIDRYRLLGVEEYHRNCADNLREAMGALDLTPPEIPSPFNIFENVRIGEKGELSIEPPLVEAGDSISLRAELDIILVLSCCPMDIALTNGPDLRSKPVRVETL
ncbi:MAG: urea carboxylase-associated family protein [Gammaproteobacteria bacterium]|nr:urea carboxylase-associated family protein [Gammaproteobacteria bacterium]